MWDGDVNWDLGLQNFLTHKETQKLRRYLRISRESNRWKRVRIIEMGVLELGLNTGLRIKELSSLCCGDIYLNGEFSFIHVRNGKGGKSGIVRIGSKISRFLKQCFQWKESIGEGINNDAPLFVSSNTKKHLSCRAVQEMFKRCCKRAGIERNVHAHMMRHTYASNLLEKSGHNLRFVQQQLRHSSIKTTETYCRVLDSAYKALDKLYD